MSKRLIENWLPIAELGEESTRERRSMTALPPTYYLHVWWARRPLVASRAAILASILPADADKEKFVHALGIHGDPVQAKQAIEQAKRTGNRVSDPYGYQRAFVYLPSAEEKDWLAYEANRVGIKDACVLDPTAGGGSIPIESVRLGLCSLANDLNPVAAIIMQATVKWPVQFGYDVCIEFERISAKWRQKIEEKQSQYFPQPGAPDKLDTTYLWARTITCPYCDGFIPLSPNWKLDSKGKGVQVVPQTSGGPNSPGRVCRFAIVEMAKEQSEGTVAKGRATCPFPDCGRVIDGEEVKAQAQDGGMGEQLFAIVYKERVVSRTKAGKPWEKWVRGYRAPQAEDEVNDFIQEKLAEKLPEWEALDIIPNEAYPHMFADRSKVYGVNYWRDLFSPRQLLCHGTSVEVFRELYAQEHEKSGFSEATKAAFGYLAISCDKLLDYNSCLVTWHANREVMDHTFRQHAFPMKWSYAEMSPLITGLGYDWVLNNTAKCITELIDLARPDIQAKQARKNGYQVQLPSSETFTPPPVTVTCKSADSLDHLEDASVDVVVMDPPYYNNVMYAELSDFFYVWLKRTAGHVYPELFRRPLTDKENEAVANPAKFKGEKGAGALADADYKDRMESIFAECRRVLKADGVMTLMFTHKATGAWDALTKGLMEAGFIITASWPINTEAEGSMHIKDKSAANSTIFLVCRPRPERGAEDEILFWEDLEPRVRSAVRHRIQDFQAAGIKGVDLYLSSFGPALEEFSRHWPVQRGQPKAAPPNGKGKKAAEAFDPYATSPEDALDAARREVKNWRMEQLTSIQRQAELDPITEWFVLAWDAFQAPRFPFDEALRLARVVGLDMDRDIIGTIAEKKTSDVILWDSATRAAKGALGPTDGSRAMLDALHHAAYLSRSKTLEAGNELLVKTGVNQEPTFLKALSAVLEVLPPSETFVGFAPADAVLPAAGDFEALEKLRRLAFGEKVQQPRQLSLWEAR